MSLPAPPQPPKSRLSKVEIVQLLADVTDTDATLWTFERGIMPYTVDLSWEVLEPTVNFVATIQGLRAAAIKNQGPPQSFQFGSRCTSMTAGFSLKQQWADSPSVELSNRQYLHLQIEDTCEQDDRILKITVFCDYWGNALRNHADLIRAAAQEFRDTRRPVAEAQTRLGQLLGLKFEA